MVKISFSVGKMDVKSIKMCRKYIQGEGEFSYGFYLAGLRKIMLFLSLFSSLLIMAGCTGGSIAGVDRTTDTRSTNLATEAEQIEFLGEYVNLKSAVSETEFHIVYHDNSGGMVPGPSDWDVRAVMVVDDVALWIEGKTVVGTADFSWADSMVGEGLRPSGSPQYFSNGSTTIAVYEPENIILFYSTTMD